MSTYTLHKAGPADTAFLVEAIIAAEKSNSDRFGLATFFGLEEARVAALIKAMLEEEIDGCEFSTSSFLIAQMHNVPVAAAAGWIEGLAEEMPSALLKSNLIGFTFPPESMAALRQVAPIVSTIQIERELGALQIEYVYVRPEHRGHRLAGTLIARHIADAQHGPVPVMKAAVQAFANNHGAIHAYEQLGFRTVRTVTSSHPEISRYLPYHEKVLMEKHLA